MHVFSNHGSVCSCVGPIIDVNMKCFVFNFEKFMIIQIARPSGFVVESNVFLPSVYDAILVIRPSCNFRDGRVINNYTVNYRQYLIELPFNDGSLLGLIHLLPVKYLTTHSFWNSRLHDTHSAMCNSHVPCNMLSLDQLFWIFPATWHL